MGGLTNEPWFQILTLIVTLFAGGFLRQLLMGGSERRKLDTDAAKVYHDMSMEIFREIRIEADKLQLRVQQLTTEVESLQRQVHLMTLQLEEKDKIIESLKRGNPLYEDLR